MKKVWLLGLVCSLGLLTSCKPDICDCLDQVGEVSVDGIKELLGGEEMKAENEACWEELNQYKLLELIQKAKECQAKKEK
ncbi:MAG: hypothetical protein AAF804_09210 [Bacteroidota bacterium]